MAATSVASDPARDDPYNDQQRTETLEYQLSANPARRTKNNVKAPSIKIRSTLLKYLFMPIRGRDIR